MVSDVLFFVLSFRTELKARLRNALSWIQFGQDSSDLAVNSPARGEPYEPTLGFHKMAQSSFAVCGSYSEWFRQCAMSSYPGSDSREDSSRPIPSSFDHTSWKVNVFLPVRDPVPRWELNLVPRSLVGRLSYLFVLATGLCSEDLADRRAAVMLKN